ncbi:MAG: hypothetical protein Q4B04_03050 [bacterium]|nr:hypothetical protein [bacterium]
MRKKGYMVFILVAVLTILVPFQAIARQYVAEQYGVGLDLPDEYVVITRDNTDDNIEIIEAIGHSQESLENFMNKNDVYAIGVAQGNTRQIQLKCIKTEFSSEVDSLSNLGEQNISEIGYRLFGSEFKILKQGETVYYVNEFATENYSGVDYVTIKNGVLCTVVCYGCNSAQQQQILENVIFKEKSKVSVASSSTVFEIIIISLLILAVSVAVLFIIFSFISDWRKKRDENIVSKYIKIKRRKF